MAPKLYSLGGLSPLGSPNGDSPLLSPLSPTGNTPDLGTNWLTILFQRKQGVQNALIYSLNRHIYTIGICHGSYMGCGTQFLPFRADRPQGAGKGEWSGVPESDRLKISALPLLAV